MAKAGTVIGWTLDERARTNLLKQFPPRYEQVLAHHVTLATEAQDRDVPGTVSAAIVGRTDDGRGVEALVVTIDGDSARPDGSTFHITWSLGAARRARESNEVLKERGWEELNPPVAITLTPTRI